MENNFYHVEFFWWFLRYIMKKEGGGFRMYFYNIRDIWWGRGSSKGEGGVRGSTPSWSRLQVILRNIVITIHIFILLLNSGVICVVAFPIEISSVLLLSWRCSLPWRHFAHARFPEQPRARGGESTIFSAKVVSMRARPKSEITEQNPIIPWKQSANISNQTSETFTKKTSEFWNIQRSSKLTLCDKSTAFWRWELFVRFRLGPPGDCAIRCAPLGCFATCCESRAALGVRCLEFD